MELAAQVQTREPKILRQSILINDTGTYPISVGDRFYFKEAAHFNKFSFFIHTPGSNIEWKINAIIGNDEIDSFMTYGTLVSQSNLHITLGYGNDDFNNLVAPNRVVAYAQSTVPETFIFETLVIPGGGPSKFIMTSHFSL